MGQTAWVLIAIGAGLLLLLVTGYILWRRFRRGQPRDGEAFRAVGPMRRFARSNQFRFIAPVRLDSAGKAARLEAAVVGYFGVLGLITLPYTGQIYGSAGEKTWVQVTSDTRTNFENPIQQASAAVRAVRDVLMQTKNGRRIPVEVVCVFTAPRAQLALPRSTGHLRVKEFKELLRKDKYLEDCGLDLDTVEAALKQAAKR